VSESVSGGAGASGLGGGGASGATGAGETVVEERSGPLGPALASARTDWPEVRTLTWWAIERPALVLGSAQPSSIVDPDAATAAGVEVCRRASGGGAVLLAPDDVLWCDLVVPPGDPRWDDDVVRAAAWVGDACVEALASLGVGPLHRHVGGLVARPWSDLVCFAGVGPGEVLLGGGKVVGISQRRTRRGARFQIGILRRWDVVGISQVLALSPADHRRLEADLAHAGAGVDLPPDVIRRAITTALR
jgi:lipoate-protein ligase A